MKTPIGICRRLVLLVLLGGQLAAANWPQFRGEGASGLGGDAPAPTTWKVETGENILWKSPVPGLAHSCPIIWNDRLYVTTAVKDGVADLKVGLYGDIEPVQETIKHRWLLLCFDKATGKKLWERTALEAIPRIKRHPKSSHCSSTPATDGQHIVAMLGAEGLYCFDMEGKPLWHKDLGPLDSGFYRSPTAQWGFASSPVIHGDRVVVQCDVQTNSFVAAFALKDGRELWRTPRIEVPTWCSPAIVSHDGSTQVILNGYQHLGGYDFETGREIWWMKNGGDIPVPTPIVAHGLVYLTSAHGRFSPLTAVRLEAKGDITPPEVGQTNALIAWNLPRGGNYMQTPLVAGDRLYCCNDAGIFASYDARTGQNFYKERLGGGGQGFTASPVFAGGKLYATSETGNVYVIPAGDTFAPVATNSLGNLCMTTPAISEGTIYFRTKDELIAVGAKTATR